MDSNAPSFSVTATGNLADVSNTYNTTNKYNERSDKRMDITEGVEYSLNVDGSESSRAAYEAQGTTKKPTFSCPPVDYSKYRAKELLKNVAKSQGEEYVTSLSQTGSLNELFLQNPMAAPTHM
jgi:hypothetical protein